MKPPASTERSRTISTKLNKHDGKSCDILRVTECAVESAAGYEPTVGTPRGTHLEAKVHDGGANEAHDEGGRVVHKARRRRDDDQAAH